MKGKARNSCKPGLINNGHRTKRDPVRSVIMPVINKIGRPRKGESD